MAGDETETGRHSDSDCARSVDPVHSPEIYGQTVAGDKTPSQRLINACPATHRPSRLVEERELRVLLMRKYQFIEELKDDREFCHIVVQFTDCESPFSNI